ncbi:HIT family protein [Glaciimonas soli]|uniref:HIT domain-containing protein n=1 Tax=Glaciimonas soli TaxID=2590999 RepID=A0A843YSX4_9BURK|nr:HIT family protein [Glaciimonas soli]MQR00352.1 HIT domain-containing protein [Glaciimonas soli]
MTKPCELCSGDGGEVLHRTEKYRVVLIDDAQYPGFCRVIWNAHVKEMTDLSAADRNIFMQAVWQVETVIRSVMQPEKINLACFGNMTPHLHWHVIPRYLDDVHFPNPVWGAINQEEPAALAQRRAVLPALKIAMQADFKNSLN